MGARSLYDVLGVERTASTDDIKRAWRRVARRDHPDLNPGDAAAEARFKEAGAAYEVLSDPEKRRAYDAQGGQRRGRTAWGDVEDLFDFRSARGPRRRGVDLRADLAIDFRDAALGGEHQLVLDGRSVTVRIPPGVSDGGTIRLRGQGMPGPAGPGDLLLTLHVAPDPLFRRDDLDLHLDLPLTVGEAVRGATVRVPTLHGAVDVRVPPGSQPGRTLRLRGKGVARRDRPPGDLFVHLQVQVPPRAPAAALDALDAAYPTHPRAQMEGA